MRAQRLPLSTTVTAPYRPANSYSSRSAVPARESSVPNVQASKQSRAPYLFTDSLPAVLTFDGMFDNRVVRRPSVHECNGVQRDTDADEVENFVDEGANRRKKIEGPIQSMTRLAYPPWR